MTKAFPLNAAAVMLALLSMLPGCGPGKADRALDSDVNGYYCSKCKAKFYTDRNVFAYFCAACKDPAVETVEGIVCPDDKHVTYRARGRGSRACEQCGKPSSAIIIPREAELKAWGAVKKSAAEVGVK
jgi:Zn finger protein HypA/HybF involved in hydrogenase expression